MTNEPTHAKPERDAELASAPLQPRLSCLVVGEANRYVQDARKRLERSSRVGRVEVLDDDFALGHALVAQRQDLVVLVLSAPDAALPRCLLKHPEVRVLVVAPDGVCGTLTRWLQQGADDLICPDDTDAYDHALSRLLDACSLSATARRQAMIIDVQRQRIEAMMARSIPSATPSTTARSSETDRRNAVPQRRGLNLLRRSRKPRPDERTPRTVRDADSDGLAGRPASMKRLLALAARPYRTASHAVVVQVTLPFAAPGQATSRLDNTIADLAIYRAADALRRYAPKRLLLGRVRKNRLLMLIEMPATAGTDLSARETRLREQLGTLGGLLLAADELDIDMLRAPLASVAVPSLIDRMEQRYSARHPSPSDAPVADAANDSMVPTVTARVPRVTRPRAAAQS